MAKTQSDSVYRIIDVVGVSETSWEDAGRKAVETAASSLRDLRVRSQGSSLAPLGYYSDSYLNDSATRVRNAVTFPLSTFISIFVTSATGLLSRSE
jgi:hypothetical protein